MFIFIILEWIDMILCCLAACVGIAFVPYSIVRAAMWIYTQGRLMFNKIRRVN